MSDEPVYEMLWDCKFCGHKKLLGITHRFCANCGGPQDPQARYFPPDEEKVAVQNHPYVGADVTCPACRQPMSRNAKCCTNCGSPIDKGADVGMRADVVVPPPVMAAPPVPPAQKSNSGKIILGVIAGIIGIIVILIVVTTLWKREGVFEVTSLNWERNIAIEKFEPTKKSVWCDETPAGARVISKKKEQKGTTKEKDGETCGMRKKDLGNGAYKEVKECTPKFKDVPTMADKCDVEITEWHASRTVSEKGVGPTDTPRWPVSKVAGGTCIGCEREGEKTEKYTVKFIDTKSKTEATCDLPEPRWSSFKKGSKWKGKVRVLSGGLDCDNLGPS